MLFVQTQHAVDADAHKQARTLLTIIIKLAHGLSISMITYEMIK